MVLSASKIELAGLPLKSEETRGSSQYSRIPRSGSEAASRNAALTASTVAGFSRVATKSHTETVGVGTRRAMPSRRPLSSGMTTVTARAAPVVVGMMLSPAERARRRSLWTVSRMTWSLV